MAHRLPLADIAFIADFAAFARSKGDEEYDYCDPPACALGQYVRHAGIGDGLAELPCGVHRFCGSDFADWDPGDGTDLKRVLLNTPRTFSALADRLEALIATAPEIVR